MPQSGHAILSEKEALFSFTTATCTRPLADFIAVATDAPACFAMPGFTTAVNHTSSGVFFALSSCISSNSSSRWASSHRIRAPQIRAAPAWSSSSLNSPLRRTESGAMIMTRSSALTASRVAASDIGLAADSVALRPWGTPTEA